VSNIQAQIDSYLDRICRPLARTLSAEEVAEQRAEMRTHLESLFAAYLETGKSEAEAIRLSLEQFGKEQKLQNAWRKECETTQLATHRSALWPGFRFGVRTFLMASLFLILVNGWACFIHPRIDPWLTANLPWWEEEWLHVAPIFEYVYQFCFVLLPIIAGIRVGCRVQDRPLLVCLLTALFTCVIVPPILATTLFVGDCIPVYHPQSTRDGVLLWFYAWRFYEIVILVTMLIFGAIGAIIGQLPRRFQRRKAL